MMNNDTEMMDNQGVNLPYEQPSLKKYGTMAQITFSSGGSGADVLGRRSSNTNNVTPDPSIQSIGPGGVVFNPNDPTDDRHDPGFTFLDDSLSD